MSNKRYDICYRMVVIKGNGGLVNEKFYYCAKLNDNNVCVEIQSKVGRIPDNTDEHIELSECN
ncbi:hypothetical protein U732_2936 [Clostridium argentinense CDC 2741]|uniref:Uncharacterized protein n=2 Tax=Clostridium argentinense TaxID=29341 RepID=A0A0C1R263_9CLOT|nr:hypothetical protein [Clostridium argentinense]KIE47522.1 hypothetical protein U732_2936 [Clostridium argentinense CDC 2741]NFF38674.1 hypothetical protein [Clostridium argentinense]NFP48899.1 hypothetical protein [Clostridium argentinense]NFP72953.1 hypothetical protein [Clostridium argentinense]NFP75679.1 hypothetical protein [Clostridium argentinense]